MQIINEGNFSSHMRTEQAWLVFFDILQVYHAGSATFRDAKTF